LYVQGALPEFANIMQYMTEDADQWAEWIASEQPQFAPLPKVPVPPKKVKVEPKEGEEEGKEEEVVVGDGYLNNFQKLILIKVLREEKVTMAASMYVGASLGQEFTEPRPWNLQEVRRDRQTPSYAPR